MGFDDEMRGIFRVYLELYFVPVCEEENIEIEGIALKNKNLGEIWFIFQDVFKIFLGKNAG
jgi:hypothetical protein